MKTPFVTKNQIEEITKTIPTPFNIYDEKGIRENARAVNKAFNDLVPGNCLTVAVHVVPHNKLREREVAQNA